MSRAAAPTQASPWEWATAVLGVALLALVFAQWFQIDWSSFPAGGRGLYYVGDTNFSLWNLSTVTTIAVLLFSLAAVAQAVVLSGTRSPGIALAWNVGMNWAAIVIVVWVLVRLLFPPDHFAAAWAGWTSLAVAVAMLVVGWLGMRDERDQRGAAPDVPLRPVPAPPA